MERILEDNTYFFKHDFTSYKILSYYTLMLNVCLNTGLFNYNLKYIWTIKKNLF